MARTGAAPTISFIPALPRNGHVTDAGRSCFFTVTPGEGVTLRAELGARLPLSSKVALRFAVLAAYRATQAATVSLRSCPPRSLTCRHPQQFGAG